MDVPLIHVGDYDLAITPWTSTCGSHRMDVDDILPPLPLTPTRRPRSPEKLHPLGLVVTGMPPHLFAMYWMLLPRIFTNICQLRDVYADRSDYSLRANTFAPPGAIPRATGPSGHGGGQIGHRLQLCMVQLVDTSPLTTYLSTKTIHKLQYLMGILMQVS